MGGPRRWCNDEDNIGRITEYEAAEEALQRLRVESKRQAGRPYRAATLAEAEQIAVAFEDQNRTPRAMIREHGLTVKAAARCAAYSANRATE